MQTDADLLRAYAHHGDETAFAALVRRHLDLVHSAALRQVNGDAHLAADVTQAVFVALARKAGAVAGERGGVLAGWLFTSTRFAAAKAVRGERRRAVREQTAATMDTEATDGRTESLDWERARPVIDAALGELAESERTAILLRYFEGRDYATIGAGFGVSDNTARMRVERALDKLRERLGRRGVTSTSAALALALGQHAVTAAPGGLAASVTGAALAGGAAAAGGGIAGAFMSMTKLQLAAGGAAAALGLGGWLVQAGAAAHLRAEAARLAVPAETLAVEKAAARQLAQAAVDAELAAKEAALLPALRKEEAALGVRLAALAPRPVPAVPTAGAAARGPLAGPVYESAQLDVPPRPTFQARPGYPAAFRSEGIGGEALLEFVVDAAGEVRDATAVRTTHPEFATAALEAVAKWRFQAGVKDTQAVNTRLRLPMKFTIGTAADAAKGPRVPTFWF
jgi:RNA polymerase sigma factor (sigma-70 family)